MTALVLVTSEGDWGDELNLEGFGIFTVEKWEKAKANIPENKAFELYYGSNEFVCFEGKDDYLGYLKETPITEAQAKGLCTLLRTPYTDPDGGRDSAYVTTYGLFVFDTGWIKKL